MKNFCLILKGGRLLRSEEATRYGRPAWDATGCCVCGGMMKRKIFETLIRMKTKFVLCMMIAGFTAINSGFTGQDELPPVETTEPAPIEDTGTNIPTAIAVNENGKLKVSDDDELTRLFIEQVEASRKHDIDKLIDVDEAPSQAAEVATVEEVPENVVETAQGYLPYSQVMSMEATAYLPTDGNGAGLTAMGIPATYGVVAVDPDVIPLGSRVYIPGYGEALAADTGGAIYGYRIDLCMEDYWQAMDFGRREITVFVLK